MKISGISNRIASTVRGVIDYTRARPTSGGDLPTSSTASAALAGTFQGWISGGPVNAFAGLLGGYAGVKVGEATQSFVPAVGAGALAGAATATATTAALACLLSAPIASVNLSAAALLGGFAGAVGTLSGSRRASTRDGVYGGMILGALGGALSGNPLWTISGAAGAGIGGKAPTPIGRAVLGTLAGAGAGAVSGVLGGPSAMLFGSALGAALGASGALLGPVVRQAQRNLTEDLTRSIIVRLDPYLKTHHFTPLQKIALGATAGALTIGPLGLIFGLKGLGIAAAIGATVGAASTANMLSRRAPTRQGAGREVLTAEDSRRAVLEIRAPDRRMGVDQR